MADETMRSCWCGDAQGLLRAFVPYGIRSFNGNLDDSKRLFADQGITDVGTALQPFHEGEIVADS